MIALKKSKRSFMINDHLDQWTMVFTGLVLLTFMLSEIGKLFLDNMFLHIIWTTTLKFTFIFLRSLVKMKKYVIDAHASVHFKIGSLAKNA